jgi:hypothetical protein
MPLLIGFSSCPVAQVLCDGEVFRGRNPLRTILGFSVTSVFVQVLRVG